jgi:alkylated DNA repair protein (DNA oxidative demethylase)
MLIAAGAPQPLARDVWLLAGYVRTVDLLPLIEALAAQSPFRHMEVASGARMSVALTNCGALGWVSDRKGYRYAPLDPLTGKAWPPLPAAFIALARAAAAATGWPDFAPDACLVNRYVEGAAVGLHQDRNERDFLQPIVSVSIGASCRFMLGGLTRSAPVKSLALHDGDVMVWGGSARLVYHGVRPIRADALHPQPLRFNLTFRKAG